MPIPKVLAARMANEPEGKNVGERLPCAGAGFECLQALVALGGERFSCTREDGHDGLCVAHDEKGNAVAVSRWARRR